MARDIVRAYLQGEAGAFFADRPTDAAARRRAVERARRPLAPDVAAALEAENARLAPSRARDAHLAQLRAGAACVVTGQQVGLFLGPLYTLYKAASAIRVARALADETGTPVVPVFWLQTEDHDLPEIASCGCAGAHGGSLELRLPASAEDRVSIAHVALPAAVESCLAELRAEIGGFAHAEAHLARLARHYRPGATWGEAFAGVLAELFADEGLVFVDPRTPALAAAARPVHERAIVDAAAIAAALGARARELEAAGFTAPVHVRPDAPLSFFHPEGAHGPRQRVDAARAPELLAALAADPLAVSTSALLRPILQDTLLPTAAYVGGPGEIAYFAQLAPLYAVYGLPMPLVVHRARFTLVEARSRAALGRLGLGVADLARPQDEVLAACRRGDRPASWPAPEAVTARLTGAFEAALAEVAPSLAPAGPEVARGVAKTRASVARSVGKLVRRYQRALLRADRELVDTVSRLRALLAPGGGPQERWFGLPYFAARHGDRALASRVLAAIDPFDPTVQELTP